MKKILIITALIAFITGCATTRNYDYNAKYSRAYNLAKAGGLYDARDYTISKSQRESLTSKGWDATSNSLLLNSKQGLGMDWSSSFGLGIFISAIKPKGVMERDSIFGWVPSSLANNQNSAWKLTSETLVTSIEKAMKAEDLTYEVDLRNKLYDLPLISKYFSSAVRITAPEFGCPSFEARDKKKKYLQFCSITTSVFKPTSTPKKIPNFILNNEEYGYGFYADDAVDYSQLKVNIPIGSKLNKENLIAAISRELPPWIFLFVASEKREGGKYTPPMVLSSGKLELFIKP